MRKFYGMLSGLLIGALLGFTADQILTTLVLQNAEEAAVVIISNALGAFVVFPLLIILCGFLGYRWVKHRE